MHSPGVSRDGQEVTHLGPEDHCKGGLNAKGRNRGQRASGAARKESGEEDQLHPEQWNSPNVKPGDHHRNDAHLTLNGGSACLHSFMLRPKDSSISPQTLFFIPCWFLPVHINSRISLLKSTKELAGILIR